MEEKLKDTQISICNKMTLVIKEVRGTSTCYTMKESHEEVETKTKTHFHWKLHGLASKFSAEVVKSGDFDRKQQEVYYVEIKSELYDIAHHSHFKTREAAIANALEFAERNGIEVDGYKPKPKKQ